MQRSLSRGDCLRSQGNRSDSSRHHRPTASQGAHMSTPRRVLGYARVSSAEQALGSSLKDQQASIAAYASSRGLKVTQFFVESESGGREKIERREQMQALMRDVRNGD